MKENLESKTNAKDEKMFKKLLVGGALAGLAGAVAGNLLDNEPLEGFSYGVLGADAVMYLVYQFKIKNRKDKYDLY